MKHVKKNAACQIMTSDTKFLTLILTNMMAILGKQLSVFLITLSFIFRLKKTVYMFPHLVLFMKTTWSQTKMLITVIQVTE
jgi:hypothetical protein